MSEPDLVAPGTPIDLDNCAREPIHIPGSVQPRGVLLVVQEPAFTVTQVSLNIADLLGVPAESALGAPLSAVVGVDAAAVITRSAAVFSDLRERNPIEVEIVVDGHPAGFDAILHREAGGLMLVELELSSGPRPFSFPNTYLAVRGTIGELNQAANLAELYDITANAVRELTGFDRVMVYRYDADYNGEVVAEARREDLNPFLGLHYPASDIPAQARALYEKNWLRLISDVDYTAAPLVPVANPVTGRPMDLTYATLRSVSPIHIEYLKNMGVGASMSISLLRNGTLWGLIACHHYSGPHLPPYGVRAAAEFLGSALSLRLVDRHDDEVLRGRLAAQTVLGRLASALSDPTTPLAAALAGRPGALELIDADGLAIQLEGQSVAIGAVPDAVDLPRVVAWLHDQPDPVACTDFLGQVAPDIPVDPALVSGLLGLAMPDGQYVIWFRREAERSVDWGGDPANKAIAVREGDDVRLSPRKSFERWRQVVRSRSAPWTEHAQSDAAALRQRIVEALYSRSQREAQLAESLQRSLLPDLPLISGWDLSAYYEPAAGGRIGGDWYDAFVMPDGRLVIVLGDVAGHGIGAAGTMAQLRNVLRAYLVDGVPTVGAVERLNHFTQLLLPGAFATVALACIDVGTGAVDAVIAGHPMPFVVDRAGGVRPAPLVTSPPVGVPGAAYSSAGFTLDVGDRLVFFSDGLVERRTEDMSESLHGLISVIGGPDWGGTAPGLFDAMITAPIEDDATVVVLRRG